MSDLISREEAIKCLDGNILITGRSEAEAVREYFEMVIKRLENLPTIDLVRCGECKWCEEKWDSNNNCPTWECKNWLGGTDYDGYCHEGERRADDNTD